MNEKKADLIANMFAKAESTTPEEALALTEAAEKLMVKYLIDQATIDERRAKKGQSSEKIIERTLFFTGAYRGEMIHLSSMVVFGLGSLRMMQQTTLNKGKTFAAYLVGFESDVAQAEILIKSLQLQAAVAVRAYWKENASEYLFETAYNQEKARRSFVFGFGTGAGMRIKDSRATIIAEASTGTELVLVSRKEKVDAHMDAKELRRGRSRNAATGGSASGHGYRAGQNANTGEKGLSQGRGISA